MMSLLHHHVNTQVSILMEPPLSEEEEPPTGGELPSESPREVAARLLHTVHSGGARHQYEALAAVRARSGTTEGR